MKTAWLVLIILLAATAYLALPANADVYPPTNTTISFTPGKCVDKSLCNTFHIRFVRPSGVVLFERSIQSTSMASNTSIEVDTGRLGKLYIVSER